MTDFLLDCRDVWRRLRRAQGFAVVAVLTLALGIATTTTVFAVVYGLLLKPIGGVRVDNVFLAEQAGQRNEWVVLREPAFRALAADPPPEVASIAAVHGDSRSAPIARTVARVPGRADEISVQGISGTVADVFGLRAQAGRWIDPSDDRAQGAEPGVVISDRLSREWFGNAATAIGASIRLGKETFRIVGVAERAFIGLQGITIPTDVWVPLARFPSAFVPGAQTRFELADFRVRAIVRLEPGAQPAAVAAALGARQAALTDGATPRVNLEPFQALPQMTTTDKRAANLLALLALLALVGACANVVNLLYARYTARAGEVALRVSLGASRGRLLRQTLVESTTIGSVAGLTGLALTAGAIAAFNAIFADLTNPFGARLAFEVDFDARVLLWAMTAGVVSGLLVGLVAALQATRVPPLRALAGSGTTTGLTPTARRMRMALVAVQVTAAVVLVMSTGMIFERTRDATDDALRIGFDAGRLTAGQFRVDLDGYHEGQGRNLFERVLHGARQLPGVEQAAIVDALPGHRNPYGHNVPARWLLSSDSQRERVSGLPTRINARSVSGTPGMFDTLGLRITRGRGFGPSDVDGAPLVAVLSESAADALWPGEDAVGKSLRIGGREPWVSVIGLVEDPVRGHRDSRVESTSEDVASVRPSNFIFTPFSQHYSARPMILVRSSNPRAQVDALRGLVRGIDEQTGLFGVGDVEKGLNALGSFRAIAALVTTLGVVALAIAMFGVYGVVSYFVSTRTREIGIRMTLGATRRGIVKMVLDYAVHIMLVGLLPGVFVAAVGSRVLETTIQRLMPNQISTWVIVPLLILFSGVLAGLVPAWRASRVDPNIALKEL